jgi:hypothetical protein
VSRYIPADPVWNYWANSGTDGKRPARQPGRPSEYAEHARVMCGRPLVSRSNGWPEPRPYRWRDPGRMRGRHQQDTTERRKDR